MLGNLFLNTRVSILGSQPSPTPAGLRQRACPSSPGCRVRIGAAGSGAGSGAQILCPPSQGSFLPTSLLLFWRGCLGLPRTWISLLLSSPPSHSSHTLHSLLPGYPSILCSSHTVLPTLSAGCPAVSPSKKILLCSLPLQLPLSHLSSMPPSLPPERLPGLLPLLNFRSVDFRSEELGHSVQMLLPSLSVRLPGAGSGLASVLTSSGCSALQEPTDRWEKKRPG